MRKFVSKVIIMGMILGSMLLLCNGAYINTAYYKNLNYANKFKDIPDHIDVINFGASHSECAFDWSGYKEFTGVNMALGAQTLVYDEALFNYYSDHLDENSTVILEVMFKSLYEPEPDKAPYETNITRYYQILPKEYIRQWNFEDAVKHYYLPILGNKEAAFSNIYKEYIWGSVPETEANSQMLVADEPVLKLDSESDAKWLAEANEKSTRYMNLSAEQELAEQYTALINIIEKCQEKNIQVILVTAPTSTYFIEGFDKDFLNEFYNDVNEICKKYGLIYIDYTYDSRFHGDYRLYKDPNHLSVYGGKVFTKAFLEEYQNDLNFCK